MRVWPRAGRTGRGGAHLADPVEHAMTRIPAARVRDTGSRRALCGANLRWSLDKQFDPEAPRACPRCAAKVKAARP